MAGIWTVLKEADLVTERRDGTRRLYRANPVTVAVADLDGRAGVRVRPLDKYLQIFATISAAENKGPRHG